MIKDSTRICFKHRIHDVSGQMKEEKELKDARVKVIQTFADGHELKHASYSVAAKYNGMSEEQMYSAVKRSGPTRGCTFRLA